MFRKHVCVKQLDQSDCGAAALATICLHYGSQVGLQKARDIAGTDRIGTTLNGLAEAAESLGFSAQAVRGDQKSLKCLPLPAIAHVTTEAGLGHFVVLHKVTRTKVLVADPAHGLVQLSLVEFCRRWTGYCLVLTPDTARPIGAGARSSSRIWRLTQIMWPHRGLLAEAALCAVLIALLGISTSYFIRHLVDSVLVRGDKGLLNALGVGMAAVILFRVLFGAMRQYLMAHISRKIDLNLMSTYTRHLLNLPMKFFEMRRVGEILSRVGDASHVREAISGVALTSLVDGTLVVVTSIVIWFYDVHLAIVASSFLPLLLVLVLAHHSAARRRSRKVMETTADLSAHLVEDISGVDTIKSCVARNQRSGAGEQRLTEVAQSSYALQMLNLSMNSWTGFTTGIAGILVLWFGGYRVIDGVMTIGELMFVHTMLSYMLEPMIRLSNVNMQIQDALIAVDRLFQIIDTESELDQCGQTPFHELTSSIRIEDVRFQYGSRREVLRGINLDIPAGSTVAIVGQSGCGKSTLLKLLSRFHDPSAGNISIDGVRLHDFDVESLRRNIGLVSQDPFIFNGTVRENLCLGLHDVPFPRVVEAVQAAGLEDVIEQMPDRYDTLIGERGANLSGGQRQRLSIARALLRNPPILLFDEATSHLDSNTERIIQANLTGACVDKTLVIVAHRLSTVQHADHICLMDNGQIVESGKHDELLALNGKYAQLWQAQTGPSSALEQPVSHGLPIQPDRSSCNIADTNCGLHTLAPSVVHAPEK